jgi:hypothetical protein
LATLAILEYARLMRLVEAEVEAAVFFAWTSVARRAETACALFAVTRIWRTAAGVATIRYPPRMATSSKFVLFAVLAALIVLLALVVASAIDAGELWNLRK